MTAYEAVMCGLGALAALAAIVGIFRAAGAFHMFLGGLKANIESFKDVLCGFKQDLLLFKTNDLAHIEAKVDRVEKLFLDYVIQKPTEK
jgi:hypothetical protein